MADDSNAVFPRPMRGECDDYYFRYIDLIPDGDIVDYLDRQSASFHDFMLKLTPAQLDFRYAPGKWTLAEAIGHVLDSERVFAYRLMCISRGETQSLPGFEQDDYVVGSAYDLVPGFQLAMEWLALRTGNVLLCRHMTKEMAARQGVANKLPVKAYAFPWIMAGHVNHHMQVAEEKYLSQPHP